MNSICQEMYAQGLWLCGVLLCLDIEIEYGLPYYVPTAVSARILGPWHQAENLGGGMAVFIYLVS